MNWARAGGVIGSLVFHACALWWWKPQAANIPLAAGEPDGAQVDVELVAAGPTVEAVEPEETPITPEPPTPEPPMPETKSEPVPELPPPPPPPDAVEEPAITEPPKPKPTPVAKPAKKPAQRPASSNVPQTASAPAPAGKVPGASAGGSDGESRARYKHRVKPTYPEPLRRSGTKGRVQILVVVSAEGRPISARVSSSSGNALFDQAALSAARSSEFYPKKSFGVAVQDTVIIPYTFTIED